MSSCAVFDQKLGQEGKGWTCELCGYKSRYKNHCTDHMYRKHARPEHLPCEYCGKVFSKIPAYRLHIKKCFKQQLFPVNGPT